MSIDPTVFAEQNSELEMRSETYRERRVADVDISFIVKVADELVSGLPQAT